MEPSTLNVTLAFSKLELMSPSPANVASPANVVDVRTAWRVLHDLLDDIARSPEEMCFRWIDKDTAASLSAFPAAMAFCYSMGFVQDSDGRLTLGFNARLRYIEVRSPCYS